MEDLVPVEPDENHVSPSARLEAAVTSKRNTPIVEFSTVKSDEFGALCAAQVLNEGCSPLSIVRSANLAHRQLHGVGHGRNT